MTTSNGPGDFLALIRGDRGDKVSTRAELRQVTGLSRVTVAHRVDALLRAGLVREESGAVSTGGRRPGLLRFDAARGVVLGASVDTTHTRVAVLDLAGAILHDQQLSLNVADGPEVVLTALETALLQSLEATGKSQALVEGIGISLPAPIDPHTGRPSQPPIMPGWDAFPVREHLQSALAVPVVVENDANAMAAGEQASEHPDSSSLCLVKVSTGIGAGVVIAGRLYRGYDGGAGDIGHVRLPGEGALCQCGAHGCLAALASGRAVAASLSSRGIPAAHGRDVARLLADGNAEAHALVRQAGRRLGEVLATVVCLLNPGVLVLAGDLASTPLVSGVREGLYPHTLPRATRNLDVRLSKLEDNAAILGLSKLVIDTILAPEAVDARLRRDSANDQPMAIVTGR